MRIRNLADGYRIVRELEQIPKTFVEAPGEIGRVGGKSIGLKWKHVGRTLLRYAATGKHLSGLPAVALAQAGEKICIPPLSGYFPRSLMAKTSWINRNNRKRATVKKYAALRAELKAKKDYMGLSQLPRDASPSRVVNRCEVTGRRRAFIRRFKISRLTFRELASNGFIPGVTKSSW
jgi:small subunit ribosomal protein S14